MHDEMVEGAVQNHPYIAINVESNHNNERNQNRGCAWVVIVVCILAFGIVSIYFPVILKQYSDEPWYPAACNVTAVLPTLDDFCVCRSLYQVHFHEEFSKNDQVFPSNGDPTMKSAVACVSVNARQRFGAATFSGDHDPCPPDGQPWKDGPIMPAHWKCTPGVEHMTQFKWTLPYSSSCSYQCQDDGCIAIMDQESSFTHWESVYVFLAMMYCFGGIPIILSTAYLVTHSTSGKAWIKMCCRLLFITAIALHIWVIYLFKTVEVPTSLIVLDGIFFCLYLTYTFCVTSYNAMGDLKCSSQYIVCTVAMAMCLAIMSSYNILFLTATLHMFWHFCFLVMHHIYL